MTTSKAKGLFLASSLCDGLEDNNIRQVATLLLNKAADPNVLIPTHGVTPFHLVIGNDSLEFAEEVTKLFLRHNGDPNVRSHDGMTPVHVAAAWGRTNILELLLANGGDPLCLDNDGRSPFHYAFDGKYFKAVTILAKYCENIQNESDEPKYNMKFDKILVTNGEIIAEYVASNNIVCDTNNVSKDNELPNFYKCEPNSSLKNLESNYMRDVCNANKIDKKIPNNENATCEKDVKQTKYISLTDDEVNNTEWNNFSQIDKESVSNDSTFTNLDFDFANLHLSDVMEKEKCLVSKIINHLSTILTSDCTINETLYNYKNNKQEKNNCSMNNSDIPLQLKDNIAFHKHEHQKKPKRFSPKLKQNHNKDILKSSSSTKKKYYSKFNTRSTIKRKDKKVPDKIPSTPNCILDNSIISMSPNFNTPNRKERRDIAITPLILSRVHNDTIVSKSPNFATPIRVYKKQKIAKTSPINNYRSAGVFERCYEHQSQIHYSEFDRCKKHVAQSTPRRKKRSIYRRYSGKRKFDPYLRENDVTVAKSVVRNILKPVNLNENIFSEAIEGTSSLNVLNSSFEHTSLNCSEFSEIKRSKYRNGLAVKLDAEKYDEDDTTNDKSNSSENLDNSFHFNKEENESVDISNDISNDRKYDIKYESNLTNSPYVTIRKNSFKIENTTKSMNSPVNIKSTYMTESNSLCSENFVECVDCDTKKLLNEDISMNISKTCDLHAKNWYGNKSPKASSCKSAVENKSCTSVMDFPAKYMKSIYLPDYQRLYSVKTEDSNVDAKKTEDIFEINNLSAHNTENSSSLLSYVTTQEQYRYEDPEEGVILLERRICATSLTGSEHDFRYKITTSDVSRMSAQSLPKELLINDTALRRELAELGDQPGPITNTTRYVYQKRLVHLRSIRNINTLSRVIPQNIPNNHEKQVMSHLQFGDWVNHLDTYRSLEQQIFQEFVLPNPSRRWREGTSKTSFTYLLLDPRITQDLQQRSTYLTKSEVWSIFLDAIFYIGKGKRTRAYAHLYEAFNIWVSKKSTSTNAKTNRILDIWNNDYGVICLHVFQNVIPVEAYTREAAMIDALGIEHLGNYKGGQYYGITATWSMQQKIKFGRYLLYKAMQILLYEGERQVFAQNL